MIAPTAMGRTLSTTFAFRTKPASTAKIPKAWDSFKRHLELCDNSITAEEFQALQKIFTEAQDVAPRDYRTCFRLIDECNGRLFKKNARRDARRHVSFTDMYQWEYNAIKDAKSTKRKIYRWPRLPVDKRYIIKAYQDPQVAAMNMHEDFKREVLYGGFLTALRPDLFAGMQRYNPLTELIIIPEVKGLDGFYYIAKNPSLNDRRLVALGLITACRHLHKLGFIHSDIKLENMMVDPDTLAVKLIDFEHVSLVDTQHPVRRFFGTYGYCLPLMYATSSAVRIAPSKWTDIYATTTAILIILFELGLTNTDLNDHQLIDYHRQAKSGRGTMHPDVHHIKEHQKRQENLRADLIELTTPAEEAYISNEFATLLTDIIAFDNTVLHNRYKTPENLWKELWEQLVSFSPTIGANLTM